MSEAAVPSCPSQDHPSRPLEPSLVPGDPGVSAPAGGCGCHFPRCGFHQLSSCPGDTRTGQTGDTAHLPPHVPPACPHHSLNSQLPPLPGSPSAGAAAPVCFWLLPSLTVIRRCVGLPVLVRPAEATRATRGARLSPFAAGFGWAGWQGMRGEGQRSLGRGTARCHPVPAPRGGPRGAAWGAAVVAMCAGGAQPQAGSRPHR